MPKDLYATIEDVAEVNLSGTLAVSRVHDKRANYNGCASHRQQAINYAAANAQNYASESYSYLLSMPTSLSGTRRYNTWFGTPYANDKYTAETIFKAISSHQFSNFTYDCTRNKPDVSAYVCAYNFQSSSYYSTAKKSFDRSLAIRNDLPLRWFLDILHHRYRFQGRNARPRVFPLDCQWRNVRLCLRSG